METKVALLVVYNHRYDKNIPIINEIYREKFSHVYHLVPFYDGDLENVIPVYDSSYYFQNYIAQAFTHIKDKNFTHFLVVADDMVLNPIVNENSLWDAMGLEKNDCYISRLSIMQERTNFWPHTIKALKYKVRQPGVEVDKILPSKEEAKKLFKKHGISYETIPLKRVIPSNRYDFYHLFLRQIPFSLELDYPLVGGYSDIFIITANEMPRFCQYCGAFAATKLFVEIAIPTSLYLTADSIKLDKDVKLKKGDIWFDDIEKLRKDYGGDLNSLLDNFPVDKLFIHPVKLSKWNFNF